MQSICAWCKQEIPEDHEVFGVKGRARKDQDLSGAEGKVIDVYCESAGRSIPVIVAAATSQARKEGWDFVIMVCSPVCGRKVRNTFAQDGVPTAEV